MASKVSDILAIAITLLFLAVPFSSAVCTEEDVKALVAFKNSFPPNTFPTSWDNEADCCRWNGVGCDVQGRVTSLSFPPRDSSGAFIPMDLNGTLPPSVGDLSALQAISIDSQRNLVGPMPANWAKLKKLQSLSIYNSSISGPVPSFLSQFESLEELQISYSKLTGTIPASLGSLASLHMITLRNNKLKGSIPSTLFSNLAQSLFAELYLADNKLTGPVPKSFRNVTFSVLFLENNRLTGDPTFLFSKSASNPPSAVFLGGNKLAFDLSNVEYPVMGLNALDLSHNRINGSISEQIKEAEDLTLFDVSYNKLCGKIPWGRHFKPTIAEYFAHNKCLCGKPLGPCK